MSSDKKTFKCPYCENKYLALKESEYDEVKKALYMHMEEKHSKDLDGMSPSQAYFNYKYNKTSGKCVIDRKPTKWNEKRERYERFCSNKCKEIYKNNFKKKMKEKYGKEHNLDNPDIQKKMLKGRSLSGEYAFLDGGKIGYVGSYEKDFLEFIDNFMGFSSREVIEPCPIVIPYVYKNKTHLYIPDYMLVSGDLNLIIEIKSDKEDDPNPNTHPGMKDDFEKEKIKDKEMQKYVDKKMFKYFKITGKNYVKFLQYLIDLKNIT